MDKVELISAAVKARKHAYAPYSGYLVGAAVLASDGNLYVGTNVENVSFGATICAERSATCAMIAGGATHIREIAIVTIDGGRPCGICLQFIAEFAPAQGEILVHCAGESGEPETFLLSQLMPQRFQSSEVTRHDIRPDSSN